MDKKKIIGIGIVAAAIIIGITAFLIHRHNSKTMINVVGMNANDAYKKIRNTKDIVVKVVREDTDEAYNYDNDYVYKQSVKKGESTDEVKIYAGRGVAYKIQPLYNKKFSKLDAATKATLGKLDKYTVHYAYAKFGAGRIMKPELKTATRVFKKEPLDIVVCKKKVPYSDEEIQLKNWNKVKKYYKGAIITVTNKTSSEKAGTILGFIQTPARQGDKCYINVTVSNGRAINVPNVKGKSEKKAIKKLNKAGVNYKIKYVYNDCESDPRKIKTKVKSQSKVGIMDKNKRVVLKINKPAVTIKTINHEVNSAGGVETDIVFNNVSDKRINYVTFALRYYNRLGDPIDDEIKGGFKSNLRYTGPLSPGSSAHPEWDAQLYDYATAVVAPESATITFKSGKKQKVKFMGDNVGYRYWYNKEFKEDDINDPDYNW